LLGTAGRGTFVAPIKTFTPKEVNNMYTVAGWLILIAAIAAVVFIGYRLIRSSSKYRGSRIVTCPETEEPAVVEVDSLHASFTEIVGPADIRLENCSRWPMKQDCGQECLMNLHVAPEQCMVSGVLMHWYHDKECVYCKNAFTELHWIDHRPALRSPEGKLLAWDQVQMAELPQVLETHLPVCWNCYIAQTFVVEHPDLVVMR
jgi:hypothetical protein